MRDQGYQRPAEASSLWFTERDRTSGVVHGTTQESVGRVEGMLRISQWYLCLGNRNDA
jgi:hypothetical protein